MHEKDILKVKHLIIDESKLSYEPLFQKSIQEYNYIM